MKNTVHPSPRPDFLGHNFRIPDSSQPLSGTIVVSNHPDFPTTTSASESQFQIPPISRSLSPFFMTRTEDSGQESNKVDAASMRYNQLGIPFYAVSTSQAVERVMHTRTMFSTGVLHEEASRLGVRPEWINAHHHEQTMVAIAEQPLPITSIFGKLGAAGSPDAMRRSLLSMKEMAQELSKASGEEVAIGMLASLEHLVTKSGLTSALYLLLPNLNKPGATTIDRARLLTHAELKKAEGQPFRDLKINPVQILQIEQMMLEISRQATIAQKKLTATGKPLVNGSKVAFDRIGKNRELAVTFQTNILDQALKDQGLYINQLLPSSPAVDYCSFVAAMNSGIIKSIVPDINFVTEDTRSTDLLTTTGVADWEKFLSAFIKAGILSPESPILRLKVKQEDGSYSFVMLRIDQLNGQESTAIDSKGNIYKLVELQEKSLQHYHETGAPLFVPAAIFRYWANFAVGNSIILEDGMPYQLLTDLHMAMGTTEFCLEPRGLNIFPYTDLWKNFDPIDPLKPYHGIEESFTALDFIDPAKHVRA